MGCCLFLFWNALKCEMWNVKCEIMHVMLRGAISYVIELCNPLGLVGRRNTLQNSVVDSLTIPPKSVLRRSTYSTVQNVDGRDIMDGPCSIWWSHVPTIIICSGLDQTKTKRQQWSSSRSHSVSSLYLPSYTNDTQKSFCGSITSGTSTPCCRSQPQLAIDLTNTQEVEHQWGPLV